MRMAGAVALLVVTIEALLALGFVAGLAWVGGLRGALLVSGIVLLVIVAPWLGDLRAWFDSAGPAGTVKLSWWGRLTFRTLADATELRVRFLIIPWRRRLERKPKHEEPLEEAEAPAAEAPTDEQAPVAPKRGSRADALLRRVDAETVEGFSRVFGAGLQALNELTWGAAEIAVRIDDPAQQETADRTLERVMGRREVGPIDLMVATSGGGRRVRLRYRIGMLRAGLAMLQMAVDGRVVALARTMKQKKQAAAESARDGDEELIERIIEDREDGRDV